MGKKAPVAQVEQVAMDDQPEDGKLTDAIKEAHRVAKTQVLVMEDSAVKTQITRASKAASGQLNTAEFRKFIFRQGAACDFPELNQIEEDKAKEDDDEQEQDEDTDKTKAA